jgi:flagellar basal-body rod protein FlgC
MFAALDISGSALVAQRTRLDVIAGNLANAQVTRQEDGRSEPYWRRVVTFSTGDGQGGAGVHVAEVLEDPTPFRRQYAPNHPDALQSGPWAGYVQLPNVNITMEYVDAMAATRAYEANVAMMSATKDMVRQTIRMFA